MSAVAERSAEFTEPGVAEPGIAHPAELADEPRACEGVCPRSATEANDSIAAEVQRRWALEPLSQRLGVVRKARHLVAENTESFAQAISANLHRSPADTLVAELLPLLDAMRFLERRAGAVLARRVLGRRGRPLWLTGVRAEIERVPLGHILVIGPSNFPLLLPGVQTMQALTAGNAVTWKPGSGGRPVALMIAQCLREAGLPPGLLSVTEESVEAAQTALSAQPDKVVFTGSFESGKQVMRRLAETGTPSVMELSGADAVIVLPSAGLAAAAKAIAFGLRLNGGEVCMSPRRLFATPETMRVLLPLLEAELALVPPIKLKAQTAVALRSLLDEALANGAQVIGTWNPEMQRPLLVNGARPAMRLGRTDIFAPVLSIVEAPSVLHMPELVNDCPYALTAAVFGAEREAVAVGKQLRVGTVLVNDLIAPTADPRIPFGGQRQSGFGATRGVEGLLELTSAKATMVRRKPFTQPYEAVGLREIPLFTGLIGMLHGRSVRARLRSLWAVAAAGRSR